MIDSNDPRLTAYALGELDDADRQAVEDALAKSPQLREEVEEIRRSVDLLATGLQAEHCPQLTGEQREQIATAAASSSSGEVSAAKPVTDSVRQRRFALALAVSLLIVASGVTAVLLTSGRGPFLKFRHTVAKGDADVAASDEPASATQTQPTSDERWSEEHSGRRQLANENQAGAIESQRLSDSGAVDRAWSRPSVTSLVPVEGEIEGEPDSRFQRFAKSAQPVSRPERAAPNQPFEDMGGYPGMPGLSGGSQPMGAGGMGMGMGRPAEPTVNDPYGSSPTEDLYQGFKPAPAPGGAPQMGGYDGRMDGYGEDESDGGMMGAARLPAISGGIDGNARSNESAPSEENLADLMEVAPAETPAPFDDRLPIPLGEVNRWREMGRGQGARELGESEDAIGESLSGLKRDGEESEDRKELEAKLRTARSNKPKPGTWRRAKATPNASRLMIGDHDELPLEGMQANVLIDGFRARVLLDCYYFNNRHQQLEGSFKLRLPNDASLYYFAFGESAYEYRPAVDQLAAKGFLSTDLVRAAGLDPEGILRAREGSWSKVKEARVVPREKAAHAYSETVRRRVDPALVEWSGAGVFQTRVFPLMPNKLHRIVIGYDVMLLKDGEDLVYRLDLPEDLSQCMVDLNVAALPGMTADVTPDARPFTSGGRAYYHFGESNDQQVSVRLRGKGPVILAGSDKETGDFFAARFAPDLPAGEEKAGAPQAVFLVDTSLSSRPEKFNVWLDVLEAVLTNNRDSLERFAVLFFNIESHWWKEEYTANTPENVEALLAYCHSLSLEGATDLEQALAEAARPGWLDTDKKQPSADLFLLSDGAVTWGDLDQHRLSHILQSGSSSSLFAYKTGLTGTATAVLDHLARESGGAVFSIANPGEIEAVATGHRRRPWKLLDVEVLGGSDILLAGRPQFLYPGQSLTIVGRGHPGKEASLRVRRGGENRTVHVKFDQVVNSELAPRAYGEIAVGQLEDLGSDLEDVSVAYARHFRVTGKTCSLLMLESEQDYQRFNIKAEDDAFVIQSSPSAELIAKKIDELSERLTDAKASFLAWLEKLEQTPGFDFEVPTALRLVIERMPRETFEVSRPRLACEQRHRGGSPKKYLQQLDAQQLDYSAVNAEAARRLDERGSADALRALSSLVEVNPGDPVLTRDVAFSAMEWGLSGQAYPLLRRMATIRPYEPQTYQALGQCLAELGNADLAMVYYEIALHGKWHARYLDVNQIVSVEYLHLLRKIQREQLSVQAPEYAHGRLQALANGLPSDKADLVVTMMWNTDRTDVDLHVIEPSSEECYYDHPRTRSGGQVTRDVTEGYGPEMYILPNAPRGKYRILANYFGTDANRTQVRTKVYITIYENFGRKHERVDKQTITLSESREKRELATVVVKGKSSP